MSEPDERKAALDRQFEQAVHGWGQALWVLLGVQAVVVTIAAIVVTVLLFSAVRTEDKAVSTVRSAEAALRASQLEQCSYFRDLVAAPVTPSLTPLGVRLQIDSRAAFYGLDCAGPLPGETPAFRRIAAKFGISNPYLKG